VRTESEGPGLVQEASVLIYLDLQRLPFHKVMVLVYNLNYVRLSIVSTAGCGNDTKNAGYKILRSGESFIRRFGHLDFV